MTTAILRPNATGDLSQCLQYPVEANSYLNWTKVNEAVADEDATYVHRYGGATGFADDSYQLPDIAGAGVTNVVVRGRVRRIAQNPAGGYPTTILMGVKIGANTYYETYGPAVDAYTNIAATFAS
ncbi:unnamed protein product [marine sediment metagenome]|uniref:Uncharacterized protein n=1 Tax=marine sediment metagenome TaxID=412755 RepID=X1UU68_9ZZZZ